MERKLGKSISRLGLLVLTVVLVVSAQAQINTSEAKLAVMQERLEETVTVAMASALRFYELREWDLASTNLDVAFESLAALSLDRILKGQQVNIVEQLLQFGDHNLTQEQLTNIIEEVYQNSTNGYSFSTASSGDFEASQELSVALEFIGHVKKENDQSALKVELESAFELAQQLHQSENEFYATLGGSVLDSLRTLSMEFPAEKEPESPASELTKPAYTDLSELYAKLVRPKRHDFDFDPDNRYIRGQVRMLLTKRRRELDRWLTRITYYMPEQREIFDGYNLPKDLVFLSVIESGLNPRAYSRAAAKGMWQFIYSTGKLYGLKRTYWKEERYDPILAGRAAARHLRDLYNQFRDWELAIAAYNSGAGRVLSAIRRGRSRNFWKIRRYLPRETRDYVPIFYAMLSILKNPKDYGIRRVKHVEPIQYDVVRLPEATDLQVLARCAGTNVKELRHLNPSLRRGTTPPETDFAFRIPKGSEATFTSQYVALDVSERRLARNTHRVQRGETLSDIAATYGMSHNQLAALNKMGGSRTIYPGQVLKVPANSGTRIASVSLDPNRYQKTFYTVRSGDTLSEIAEYKFKTRASQLRRWNDLSYYDKIFPGQQLLVWVKK